MIDIYIYWISRLIVGNWNISSVLLMLSGQPTFKQWDQSWFLEKQELWACFTVAQKIKPLIPYDFSQTMTLDIVILLVNTLAFDIFYFS